jgi:hypothetical protein
MTPLRKSNSFLTAYFSELRNKPYLKINLVFAYSFIFSPDKNNYPVVCIYEKVTGEQCFSCGLSHSFSLILRGRFNEAFEWNPYGLRVFLFFFSQLLIRILFSFYYLKEINNRRQLILYDIFGSTIIFLIVFYPFFLQLFKSVFS